MIAVVTGFSRQRVEVDDGTVELVVDVDVGDRDELQPFVVDLHELVGDHLAQRLAEPGATAGTCVRLRAGVGG